jgi:hypothetical protein
MSTLQEIELAIQRLSDHEKSELRAWMDSLRALDEAKRRQEVLSQLLEEQFQRLATAVKLVELSPAHALKGGAIPPSSVRPAKYLDKSQWAAAFEQWIKSNRDVKAVADDSRDSIYAGRGE